MKQPSKPGELSVSRSVVGTWRTAALSSIASINRRSKMSRRFVSKEEYLVRKGQKAALSSVGIAMFCMGFVGIPLLFGWVDEIMTGYLPIIISGGSLLLVLLGAAVMKWGRTMNVGVPLTCDHTVDLPAEDSLVRASQEPVQEQTSVLLRMALPPQSTPPEEMVRVAVEPQHREAL